jgi:mannitol/fructose-specific phosphotransferase system IIA component (Ntr-type)
MNLYQIIDEKNVFCKADFSNAEDVLKKAADAAAASGKTGNYSADKVYKALAEREKIGSTGFGSGYAIPHCALKGIDEFSLIIVHTNEAIEFKAIDKKPVDLFFVIVGPEEKRNTHIQILSALSRALKDTGANFAQKLREATTANEVLSVIRAYESFNTMFSEKKEKALFQVMCQNEDVFEDIIEVFSSDSNTSINIIDSVNAGYYLNRMPLFAAYWGNSGNSFNRIIVATADKSSVNNIIREINTIVDLKSEEPGVHVSVSDLLYSAGSVSF